MRTNPSRDQLAKSLDRRIKHLMIRTLEKFEDTFPEMEQNQEGQIFKGDLRNIFNDVMRAQRDELNDYMVEYRPLHIDHNNVLSMTHTFLRNVQLVDFGIKNNKPFIKFNTSDDKYNILEALKMEIGAGVISKEKDKCIFEIFGIQACIDYVIPVMDKYILNTAIKEKYNSWRNEVINLYRS